MKIVLLPGMDGTGILFEPLKKELGNEQDIQVISYAPDLKQTYTQLVEQVRTDLPEKEEFVLVAESFAGPIGYQVAVNSPANLKAVIFVGTFLTLPKKFKRIMKIFPLGWLLNLPIPTFVVKTFFLGKDIPDEVIGLFRQSIKQLAPGVLAFRLKELYKLKASSKVIEVPCSYIIASNDKLVPKSHVNEYKSIAPQLDVVQIKGPHFIVQANPEECAKVVKKYMKA